MWGSSLLIANVQFSFPLGLPTAQRQAESESLPEDYDNGMQFIAGVRKFLQVRPICCDGLQRVAGNCKHLQVSP